MIVSWAIILVVSYPLRAVTILGAVVRFTVGCGRRQDFFLTCKKILTVKSTLRTFHFFERQFFCHFHFFVILKIFASNFFFVRGTLLILFFYGLKIVFTVFFPWVMGNLDFPRALLQEKIK